ncbi:MAG: hypothetical protein ACE5GQ_11545 [Nitrospinales bacterium]
MPTQALRFAAPVSLASGERDAAFRRFDGIAYSGKEIAGHPFWGKVIFDLSTTTANTSLPILLGHDRDKIVGFTDRMEIADAIRISGKVTNSTRYGVEVAKLSDEGFPWQMSVHIEPEYVEKLADKQETFVNGQRFAGPGNIFRNSRIREVSFTPTGMDDKTSAHVMADGPLPAGDPLSGDNGEEITITEIATAEGETRMSEELKARLEVLEKENQGLKAELEATRKTLDQERSEKAEWLKAKRFERLKTVFHNLGKELKESDCEIYFSMKDEFFERVIQDLEAVKPSVPQDSKLSSEEATDGIENDNDAIVNRMAAMP